MRPDTEQALRRDGLHVLGPFALARLLMRAGVRHRIVPREFWTESKVEYGPAVVACPCGESAIVELASVPTRCEGCERFFFYDGTEVWAFNSPDPA